jgi:hypothetical protein
LIDAPEQGQSDEESKTQPGPILAHSEFPVAGSTQRFGIVKVCPK